MGKLNAAIEDAEKCIEIKPEWGKGHSRLGVALFTRLEGWAPQDAAYYAVVTGTTIGYGDMAPKTDEGRIAAALYAVVAVNVVGALLDPAKEMLSRFVNEDVSFDDVDTDHDGNISKEEFAAMQKKQKKASSSDPSGRSGPISDERSGRQPPGSQRTSALWVTSTLILVGSWVWNIAKIAKDWEVSLGSLERPPPPYVSPSRRCS